ncbi:MAG: BatC protein, partial [Actinomycetota bacterium]|nr:BatC protein [Actinomycetota bacterium]
MALGSNGSRTAPQPGSVRGAFAFGAAGDGAAGDDPAEGAVAVVGVGDDTVATVRARSGCAVEGAA